MDKNSISDIDWQTMSQCVGQTVLSTGLQSCRSKQEPNNNYSHTNWYIRLCIINRMCMDSYTLGLEFYVNLSADYAMAIPW